MVQASVILSTRGGSSLELASFLCLANLRSRVWPTFLGFSRLSSRSVLFSAAVPALRIPRARLPTPPPFGDIFHVCDFGFVLLSFRRRQNRQQQRQLVEERGLQGLTARRECRRSLDGLAKREILREKRFHGDRQLEGVRQIRAADHLPTGALPPSLASYFACATVLSERISPTSKTCPWAVLFPC